MFGDPARGSYLAAYWILEGRQEEWDAWVAAQMPALVAEGRMFPGRDHLHTAVYRMIAEVGWRDGPPAIAALDRCLPGVIAVASTAPGDAVIEFAEALVGPEVPTIVVFERERVILAEVDPGPHRLALCFAATDVIPTWHTAVVPALERLDHVGYASPFLRTIPGSDAYVDEL
jgi:hypothetical protein